MKTTSYDKGTAKGIKKIGSGVYEVESWKEDETNYTVNLNSNTCTCPHHIYRNAECKHIQQAKEEAFRNSVEIAKTQTLENLKTALFLGNYRPEVEGAIRFVIRQKEKEEEARRKFSESVYGKKIYNL